jgi:peroxiredoxin
MEAWARVADPQGKVRFFSDRNLSFARALGLNRHEPRLFLGECSERYLLSVQDGVIESSRVEEGVTDFGCTNVDALVLEGA